MLEYSILNNFVDEYFENAVQKIIPNKRRSNYSKEFRNQIIRYGVNKPYDNNIASKRIPEIFTKFSDKILFDSVTINEYLPDQMINWHIDKGENDIFIISLLSDAEMEFRNPETDEQIKVLMPRYSLFRMSGDLRYKWQHHLKASSRRISVVFRKS